MLGCFHAFSESKMVVTKSFQDWKWLPSVFWIGNFIKDLDATRHVLNKKSWKMPSRLLGILWVINRRKCFIAIRCFTDDKS